MSAGPSSITCATSAAKPLASKRRFDAPGVARAGSILRKLGVACLATATVAGCSSLGRVAGNTLTSAILNQDDPELVESGLPAYLLLLDGLISQRPDNVALLSA